MASEDVSQGVREELGKKKCVGDVVGMITENVLLYFVENIVITVLFKC